MRLPLARSAHAHASIWDNKRAYAVQVEYTYLALVRARVSRTRVCTQACTRCTPGSVSSSVCTFRANAPACKRARGTTTTTTTSSPTTMRTDDECQRSHRVRHADDFQGHGIGKRRKAATRLPANLCVSYRYQLDRASILIFYARPFILTYLVFIFLYLSLSLPGSGMM